MCGETYTDIDQSTHGVCSSTAAGSCHSIPIAGTAFQSLTCDCPYPEFVDVNSADPEYAPYLPRGGCVEPIRLTELTIVSTSVEVALSKPGSMERE